MTNRISGPPNVMRWIITHVCPKGTRVMSFARQGRNTYISEAQGLDYMERIQTVNDVPSIFGKQAVGTFELRQVECYHHGDPVNAFEEYPKPEPAPDPWSCCGVPVKTVGLDVVCQGRCGRRSR